MLYPSTGSTIRGDLATVVEEAAQADEFFIGSKVAPPFEVSAKSGTYPKIQLAAGELLLPAAAARSRGSAYPEVSRSWTQVNYDCQDIGCENAIDDVDARDLGRFFDLEAAESKWTLRNLLLTYEQQVAAAIFNTSNFSTVSQAVNYADNALDTINFPLDVLTAIEAVRAKGANPNAIVCNSVIFRRIRLATKTQTWVAGQVQRGAVVNASSIQQSFADEGIEYVLVGRARYNAAAKGQTFSSAPVWGYGYIWVGRVNPNARALQDGGAAFTLVWSADGGGLYTVETYRDEKRRSNMVRVRQNMQVAVVDGTQGVLITTGVSS